MVGAGVALLLLSGLFLKRMGQIIYELLERQGKGLAVRQRVIYVCQSLREVNLQEDCADVLLLTLLVAEMGPPISTNWNNKMPPSDVDLWDWLVHTHPRGSTVTVLVLGKYGFGVCAENFMILDRQTQRAGVNVQLVICHDVETQDLALMRMGGGILPGLMGQDGWLSYDGGKPNRITKIQYRAYLITLKQNIQTLLDTDTGYQHERTC